jgi:hypothetical protein
MEPHREMQIHLIRHFTAEKRASGRLLILGFGALVFLTILLARRSSEPAIRGLAGPLGLAALIQLGVGGVAYFRTDEQMAALSRQLEAAPQRFRDQELARLERVLASYRIYKVGELALCGAGLALLLLFRHSPLLHGIGGGCLLQGSVLLALDLSARKRTERYRASIRRLLCLPGLLQG